MLTILLGNEMEGGNNKSPTFINVSLKYVGVTVLNNYFDFNPTSHGGRGNIFYSRGAGIFLL